MTTMKRLNLFVLAGLCAFAWCASASAGQYLCEGTNSVGFKWNGSAWHPTIFRHDEIKYIVRSVNGGPAKFEVVKVGMHTPIMTCNFVNQPLVEATSYIRCSGPGEILTLDKSLSRFQDYYWYGYLKDVVDTPSLTIGTCQSIADPTH